MDEQVSASLADLQRRIDFLESELGRARQAKRWPLPGGRVARWLALPISLLVFLAVAGAASNSNLAQLDARLSTLEGLLRKGAGGAVQVNAPFEVVGSGGKAILRVGNEDTKTAAVAVWRTVGRPGGVVTVHSDGGTALAAMGSNSAGQGVIFAANEKGVPQALLSGQDGLAVFDGQERQVAAVALTSSGAGQIAVWNPGTRKKVAQLTTGADGAGQLNVMGASGTVTAGILGALRESGAVVVANSAGQTVAQVSVSGDGRGAFEVYAAGAPRAVAVLTRAPETQGGLLQISNESGPVVSLGNATTGNGYLQLVGPGGRPVVEAGTLANGLGAVRAGPMFKCFKAQAATPLMSVGLPDCILGSLK